MKHLLTAIACFFAGSMSAQTPYNPDEDGNGYITIADLMSLLSVYGGTFSPNYLEIEDVCIINGAGDDPLSSDCLNTEELPATIFLTNSDYFESTGYYPTDHFFDFLFYDGMPPILPNGMQFWYLTPAASSCSLTIRLTEVNASGQHTIGYERTINYHNNYPSTILYDEGENEIESQRIDKYMWWDGKIIKMN